MRYICRLRSETGWTEFSYFLVKGEWRLETRLLLAPLVLMTSTNSEHAWFYLAHLIVRDFFYYFFFHSILDPRSSILDPRSSILDPRSSILDPRSSILDPRSSILDPGFPGNRYGVSFFLCNLTDYHWLVMWSNFSWSHELSCWPA